MMMYVVRERYSHGHHAGVLRAHGARRATDSAAYLLPHLSPGQQVLDVGCGPGTITADLAAAVTPGGHVVGVDSAPEALAAARQHAARLGEVAGHDVEALRFQAADVYALPFADASFDVVHAHQMLQHLADPVAALREMARVARPGAVIAARDADYEAMTWHPHSPGMTDWLATYRRLARANGGEPDAGRRLLAWAHEAGLDDVRAGASTWCYAGEDARWWAGVWEQRASASAFADQCRELGLADQAGLDAMVEAWRSWGARPDAWFAVLHGEILARAA